MKRSTWIPAAALALLGPLLLAGCGDDEPAKDKAFAARGFVTVTGSRGLDGSKAEGCYGTGGYSDLRAGAQVVVRDDAGKQIALGALDTGIVDLEGYGAIITCRFPFAVADVPDSGDLYSIEVAGRGEVSFQKSGAGNIALTIGR